MFSGLKTVPLQLNTSEQPCVLAECKKHTQSDCVLSENGICVVIHADCATIAAKKWSPERGSHMLHTDINPVDGVCVKHMNAAD